MSTIGTEENINLIPQETDKKAGKKPPKQKGASQKKYPSKTTINLAIRDVPKTNAKKRLPIFALCGLLIILFTKFGVADMVLSAMDNENMAVQAEDELRMTQMLLTDYAAVEEEYQNYTLDRQTTNGSLVSTMESLAIVERYLLPAASVKTFAVEGDVITVTLSSVSLDNISSIYNALMSDEKITDVRVYTASTGDKGDTTTTCNITIFLLSAPEPAATTEKTEGGK